VERQQINTLAELTAFARKFLTDYPAGGVFGLRGDLGVGKTTFVREVIQLICTANSQTMPRVISPTYVLHQLYSLPTTVDHFDLYRLETVTNEGLLEIGYFEALDRADQGGYVFVEWPERVAGATGPTTLLSFGFTPSGREVSVQNTPRQFA
jgi:tRNA threonylcarbamoyladenosine biosynthesis protein TsaE